MSRLLNFQRYFKYDHVVKTADMDKVKFQQVMYDDTIRKQNPPRMAPDSCLEDKIHVIETFKRCSAYLGWDSDDKFEHFAQLLDGHDKT